MESKKALAIIRYTSIVLVILGIVLFKQDNVDTYAVILVLLFIINNQIRFFVMNSKKVIVAASILFECILSYLCYTYYGGMVFFYFFSAVFDGVFLLDGKFAYIINGLVVLAFIVSSRGTGLVETVSGTSVLLILSVLSAYIKSEQAAKVRAEELYDQLRISEDRLRKANSDLEVYASSIEELTLLRERNRISREIHDSVGHSLSTMIIQLRAIEKMAERDGRTASELAGGLRDFAAKSLQEVRAAVREMKPREFQKYEGILAVEELVKNFNKLTGVDVRLGFTKERWCLDSDQSFVIYRVTQEFLSNSLRHGKATRVNIFMNFTRDSLVISLQDNGLGTDEVVKGVGLNGICERVDELGGTVEYNSKSGEGFLMKVTLKPSEANNGEDILSSHSMDVSI